MNREGKPNYAFIDSQNLHIGVKESSWVIDYIKLRNYLRTKYNIRKAYLFIGYIPKNADLYESLRNYNYILVFKPVLGIRKGSKLEYKGNVDAELVLHTMINFNKYEKAIIVSGDGDFHCLIEYLYQKKKRVDVQMKEINIGVVLIT